MVVTSGKRNKLSENKNSFCFFNSFFSELEYRNAHQQNLTTYYKGNMELAPKSRNSPSYNVAADNM